MPPLTPPVTSVERVPYLTDLIGSDAIFAALALFPRCAWCRGRVSPDLAELVVDTDGFVRAACGGKCARQVVELAGKRRQHGRA